MNKAFKLIPLGLVSLFSLSIFPTVAIANAQAWYQSAYQVDFFNNYLRQEFTLSSGFTGKGNNLLYLSTSVVKDSLIEKPADPVRKDYDFVGWYKETSCENEWVFEIDKVTSDVR